VPRKLTYRQQQYADAIIAAGLAPQEEVEAAFRDRGECGHAKIEAWRQILRDRANAELAERLQQEQAYMTSLTRFESCAYPGCLEKIEVKTLSIGGRANGNEEEPKPVRFMELEEQLPGWHEELHSGIKLRVPNTRTTLLQLYACSEEHKEGVYRLTGQIILKLDNAEEQRIQSIVFPWSSEETQRTIWLRGASDALDYVAQASPETPLPSPKAWGQINAVGRSCLSAFKASTMAEPSNAGKLFTDDEVALTKRYLDMFRLEFRSGLTIRESILFPKQGGFHTTFRDPRWQALYALRDQQKKEEE
jgi:hypothetical protein